MYHFCIIQNGLGQNAIIEDGPHIWIHDASSDFLADFEIEFCPKCGMQLKKDAEPDGVTND